jgi:hypothetical protein
MHRALPACNKNRGDECGKEPVFRHFPFFSKFRSMRTSK